MQIRLAADGQIMPRVLQEIGLVLTPSAADLSRMLAEVQDLIQGAISSVEDIFLRLTEAAGFSPGIILLGVVTMTAPLVQQEIIQARTLSQEDGQIFQQEMGDMLQD